MACGTAHANETVLIKNFCLIKLPHDNYCSFLIPEKFNLCVVLKLDMNVYNSSQFRFLFLTEVVLQDLRRKLPVTRTLFPWHNTLQFSLTRDITKELGIGK